MFVHPQPGEDVVDDWNTRIAADTTPPTEFSVTLGSDKSIYAGRYFIAFSTTDKQSGIDHYEVIEEPIDDFNLFLWGGIDAPWKKVRSPYLLKDQSLNSTIRVKAIDKAGNEYIATLIPDESIRGVNSRMIFSIVIGASGVVVLLVLVGALWFYRRKLHSYTPNEAGEVAVPPEEGSELEGNDLTK